MIAKTYKYQVGLFITFALFLLFTLLPYLAADATLAALFGESGAFLALTTGYLFVSAVIFFVGFLRFRNKPWLLRLSYLALAFLHLYFAGKSINWGEQIVPATVGQYVDQLELGTEFGIPVSGALASGQFIADYSYSESLVMFVIAFVLVIPVIAKILPKARRVLEAIFPVMPLSAGILVLAAFAIEKGSANLLVLLALPSAQQSFSSVQMDQLTNHAYAFALVVATVFYFMIRSDEKKKEDDEALLRELTYFHH